MIQLPIPYRSQWAADATLNKTDCGPTCLAMILNYNDIAITPNGIYDHLPPKKPDEFAFLYELNAAAKVKGVSMERRKYDNRHEALKHLRANVDANKPMIALVKYAPWKWATGNQYDWGHFVVVTGYDDTHITIHDPLFGLWVKPASKGAHFALTHDVFCAGWGGFEITENPNWFCSIAGNTTNTPKPTPPPIVPPPIIPQPPTGELQTLTPVVRQRIYALAGYRWATKPDLDDPQQAQLWLTHLGDWGQETKTHVVGSGDTMSGLAGHYYGGQNRWRAIQAYNDMHRDTLWLGERLTIPLVGQSNAHLNPTLPHDTFDPNAKSLEDLGAFIDPDAPIQDYNMLGAKSVGIGFME